MHVYVSVFVLIVISMVLAVVAYTYFVSSNSTDIVAVFPVYVESDTGALAVYYEVYVDEGLVRACEFRVIYDSSGRLEEARVPLELADTIPAATARWTGGVVRVEPYELVSGERRTVEVLLLLNDGVSVESFEVVFCNVTDKPVMTLYYNPMKR